MVTTEDREVAENNQESFSFVLLCDLSVLCGR